MEGWRVSAGTVRVLAAVGYVIATPMLVVSVWSHDVLSTACFGFICAVACLSIAWRTWTTKTNPNPKDTP